MPVVTLRFAAVLPLLSRALFLACLGLAFAVPAAAQVSTTFDADLDGWTVDGDNTHYWDPTLGNPDGCLVVPDNASGPWSTALAPDKFLGNWSGMTPADSVSYDVLYLPTVSTPGSPPAVFRISGPGGVAIYDTTIPDSVWVNVSAPIDSTAWLVQSGTWSEILQSVITFEVAVEYRSGDETVIVDNIALSGTPTSSYRPCEATMFEVNILGWAGDGTATLSRQTSDGDIGGYLRVVSSTGLGRALAPSSYHGDWSGLDGVGTIGFSFSHRSGTIVPGRELRLELSGPGGSAHVSLPSDDFLDNARLWHQLAWTLDEAQWTVDSGTWAGLLSDVTEIAISADLATSTDTYGIDNFFRNGPGCPTVPVVPITFYETGYSLCARTPFRDMSALALNPVDGELYGLVNAGTSVSAGGGVYRLTGGPGLGVRIHTYSGAEGLVFTADGDGFVSEDGSGDLFRFVGADSSMIWVDGGVGFGPADDDIAGLAVAPPGFSGANVSPGDILAADWGNGGPDAVYAANPDTANGDRELVPDPGTADFWDLAAVPPGDVYLTDNTKNNQLWKIDPSGTLTAFPLVGTTVPSMRALAYDAEADALYTARSSNPYGIYRIDLVDGTTTLIADGFAEFGRGNLEIDSDNRILYVTDLDDNQLYSICLPAAGGVADNDILGRRLALVVAPNPALGSTRVHFQLAEATRVRIDVVDVMGRRVKALVHKEFPAGSQMVVWDGRNDRGEAMSRGVYFLRVSVDGLASARRVVLLR